MIMKWLVPAVYLCVLVIAFIYRQDIFIWLEQSPTFPLMMLLATVFALFPLMPYKAVIAVLGYTYGTMGGAVIAWVATTIAAIVVYAVARVVYRDSGHRLIERYPALASFTKAVQTYPFRAVIIARLLPVIPQTAVNIYAGVAPVPFWTYVIASGIGKIPSILIYAYLGHGLSLNPALFGTVAAIIILLSTLLMIAYQKKGSRR